MNTMKQALGKSLRKLGSLTRRIQVAPIAPKNLSRDTNDSQQA